MSDLKSYLEEGAGAHFASNPELVQYFALPYVNDPHKHPIFKEVLQVGLLSSKLESRMMSFLQKKWAKQLQEQLLREFSRNFLAPPSDSESEEEPKLVVWKVGVVFSRRRNTLVNMSKTLSCLKSQVQAHAQLFTAVGSGSLTALAAHYNTAV